jgi:hypothetical protein
MSCVLQSCSERCTLLLTLLHFEPSGLQQLHSTECECRAVKSCCLKWCWQALRDDVGRLNDVDVDHIVLRLVGNSLALVQCYKIIHVTQL